MVYKNNAILALLASGSKESAFHANKTQWKTAIQKPEEKNLKYPAFAKNALMLYSNRETAMCKEPPSPEQCSACRAPLEDFPWYSDGQILMEDTLEKGWAVLCPNCYPFFSRKANTGKGIETIIYKKGGVMTFRELLLKTQQEVGRLIDSIEEFETDNEDEEMVLTNVHLELEMLFTTIEEAL